MTRVGFLPEEQILKRGWTPEVIDRVFSEADRLAADGKGTVLRQALSEIIRLRQRVRELEQELTDAQEAAAAVEPLPGQPLPCKSSVDLTDVRTETLVREALNDVALVVGGAAILHCLDDDLVWSILKRMDRIRVRLMRELRNLPVDPQAAATARPLKVHPAVEEFLARNRTGMGEK
jgi:hypothetical protein